ncbi:cohesin subunit SA-2-like isoform X1 [Coturnix japonica]|uniref:cohesin subunit SA-2-like isoform X1 n=1 Tax=Coturnix japonica TaxID=93934 RepID=UPI000777018F|nr:cohesin subunit SA-2-like isoform X1 [Coturnix japonica]XP_015706733.1 cohesin subunit SA-2-like isoform X1 [Coturnix japonica]
MIAEPNAASNLPSHKENAVCDETVPERTVQNSSSVRNGNLKTSREKRKVREQCENIRRNSSGSRRVSRLQNGEVVEAVTLFEVVSMGKRAMQSVVDDWVEAYKQDRNVALLDLINFFIQCSGCQGMVTAEMFQNSHKRDGNKIPSNRMDVMQKMTETFDEETGLQYKKFIAYPWILTVTWPVDVSNEDYPVIRTGPYWKKFKANFCEFIAVLVQQCQCSILYDSYLMDTIISLLTGLADSVIRAFRHTSTLAAMKLLTAVISVHLNLDVNKHNAQRLYEVEKNRISGKRTNYRLDQLERKKKEYDQKLVEIQNMMHAIFKGTFLSRYRDIVPEIRATCIEEIGNWIKTYPDVFLNDGYLKYIGWMLYDKQAEVRLKCLLGLQGIYSRKDLVSKMDLFTCRFKDRIVSMPLDKDHEVAVQAMKLLMLMSQNCEDVLSAEDCETLYQLVYTTHRPLAVAAGEFLYKRLLSHEGGEEVLSKGEKKVGTKADQLKRLICFFLESELHKHVAYLIDSLWDWAGKFLKDWECMTTLLLKNDEGDGKVLNDAQESALIEIILATVREAAEGHPPVGRGAAKKILSVKEKKIQSEDCTKITEHFIMVLPQLLAKYSTDAQKVANLLHIPQYYDLDVYSTGHLEKHLDALLSEIKDIVAKHSDLSVLEASSRTYYILCSEKIAIYSKVDCARTQLIDELMGQLNQLLDGFWQKEEGFCTDAEEISRMHSALRRIAAFHNAHDLTKWNLYDKTLKLLQFEMEHGNLSVLLILPALQCTYFSLLWQLTAAAENSAKTLLALRRELRCFSEICMCFLHHKEKEVREKAFVILCDWLLILSHQDSNNNEEAIGLLDYLPSTSLQEKLLFFIQEHVFVEEEEGSKGLTEEEGRKDESCKLDNLHKKRSLLAAYCKLIVYNVVEMAAAAEIYKHYVKTYSDFGDIIKETLSRTRHSNRIQSARTLFLCLQQLFQTYAESQDSSTGVDLSSASFINMKELARRFSLTFGWDQLRSRESVAMIHKEGIEFAFQGTTGTDGKCLPPNLGFLLIISEFSNKLLKPDKRVVYDYLQRYVAEPLPCSRDKWQPLIFYRNSLLDNEDDESSVLGSSGEWPPTGASKALSFKRKLSNGSLPETSHTEAANQEAALECASQLTSAAGRSRKRLKSQEKHLKEHMPLRCPGGLQRRCSKDEIKTEAVSVEGQAEDASEDVDVDVVGAEQDN